MCTGIPATQGDVRHCGECRSFLDGQCRGRDPQVPLQVSCGVALLGLILVGAVVFS
ncbi:MAG TPA: hypothetical protein VD860_08385 [Azospirillum sp.]|nr:hypothetical protein [Azospirillum sp.]